MPWEGNIICPKCGELMIEENNITRDATELWYCQRQHTQAEARHPVQYPYIALGQEDERQGVRRRVIKKEVIGAKLYVFYEVFYETPVG
jgi:ribosomal protein L37AE/L43A